jgi:hypothetical protein
VTDGDVAAASLIGTSLRMTRSAAASTTEKAGRRSLSWSDQGIARVTPDDFGILTGSNWQTPFRHEIGPELAILSRALSFQRQEPFR